jgi:hypothetical protein
MGSISQLDYVALGLAILIALLSLPFFQKLIRSRYAKNLHQDGIAYEDEDGVASEDSVAQFSNKAQFITIFIINILAIALSFADAIFTAVQQDFKFTRSGVPVMGIFLLVPSWVSHNNRMSGV